MSGLSGPTVFPDAGFIAGLQGAGFSEDAARLFVEMAHAFNDGLLKPQPTSQRVTTPMSFESFAGEFALAYKA